MWRHVIFEGKIQVDKITDKVCHSSFQKKKKRQNEAVPFRVHLEVTVSWESGAQILIEAYVILIWFLKWLLRGF